MASRNHNLYQFCHNRIENADGQRQAVTRARARSPLPQSVQQQQRQDGVTEKNDASAGNFADHGSRLGGEPILEHRIGQGLRCSGGHIQQLQSHGAVLYRQHQHGSYPQSGRQPYKPGISFGILCGLIHHLSRLSSGDR